MARSLSRGRRWIHPHAWGMTGPALPAPDRRTVGFLRHNFLPSSETFIYTSLRALDRYDVTVYALRRQSEAKFPYDPVITPGWFERALYRATTWSPGFFRWAKEVRVIHAHFGYTAVHALWAAKRTGRPLVTSFYGYDVGLGGWKLLDPTFWHWGMLAGRLWRRGDRFLVLSKQMRDALIARGCPEDKIRVVPLGVDLARFGGERPARTGDVTVLMVGREIEKKGFDDGLRACAAAKKAGVALKVVILGTDGPLKPQLQKLGEELGLDVAWPDPSTRVPAAMAEADILLVPSRTAKNGDKEGTPTVICEGGAAGLPVVSTRHAGIPEQVDDGATGYLAGEADVDGLAGHLVRLARDAELRRAFGAAGREKMQREYSIDAHRRNLQAVYDEVLS
jgi:colanic acid/amylovoran biosynthesis glycosyltransferase